MVRIFLASIVFLLLPLPSALADSATPSYVELHDAPAITVDWSKGDTQAVTIHGNRRLVFSNGQKGGKYILVIKQDATGSRLVTWPASVRWPGGSPQAFILTTTANSKDFIGFIYDGEKYDAVSISQNF